MPLQNNVYDCGVLILQVAKRFSSNLHRECNYLDIENSSEFLRGQILNELKTQILVFTVLP